MDIMPDISTIIDALLPGRVGHQTAKACLNKEYSRIWISIADIGRLHQYMLSEGLKHNIGKDTLTEIFSEFMSRVKTFSLTARSPRDIPASKHISGDLAFRNFKRIAPEGIIIASGSDFEGYPDTFSPDQFLEIMTKTKTPDKVPMLDLREEYRYMLEDIDEAVSQVLSDTRYILGPPVAELEKKIADYVGVKHCIGTSSGTDALLLALRALAIKTKGKEFFDRKDKIITTPFTFTATGDAILRAGATPVFVDIEAESFNIDLSKIREYLLDDSTGVTGIIPVHLYGRPCSMDGIMEFADKYKLFVLEDIAQAFGADWKGKKLGSLGNCGAFSFFPSKNLGGFGDCGMVSTNDDEIAQLVRVLMKHGGKDKYNVEHIGYNARLDTIQAAILLAKMKYIDDFNRRRRLIAAHYNKGLQGISGLATPADVPGHVYHQYTTRITNGKRDALQSYLQEKGIGSMIYYPVPLHKMKVFKRRKKMAGNMAVANAACLEVLSLPVEPLQREETTQYVVKSIRDFFQEYN